MYYSYSYKYINPFTMPPAIDSKTNIIIIRKTKPSRASVLARVERNVHPIYDCNAILFMASGRCDASGRLVSPVHLIQREGYPACRLPAFFPVLTVR